MYPYSPSKHRIDDPVPQSQAIFYTSSISFRKSLNVIIVKRKTIVFKPQRKLTSLEGRVRFPCTFLGEMENLTTKHNLNRYI